MRIAVLAETDTTETRVAATPETVKKFSSLGAEITIQTGAGVTSGFSDAAYQAQGGKIVDSATATLAHADVALCVRRPNASTLTGAKENLAVISIMDPFGNESAIEELAKTSLPSLWSSCRVLRGLKQWTFFLLRQTSLAIAPSLRLQSNMDDPSQ